jgi:hypothetical protein
LAWIAKIQFLYFKFRLQAEELVSRQELDILFDNDGKFTIEESVVSYSILITSIQLYLFIINAYIEIARSKQPR